MKRSGYFALLTILGYPLGALASDKPLPAQAERGQELFLKTSKGTACGTCHSLAGVGTAVGPDLRTLASVVGPRPLVRTIQTMSVTEYVQDVQTSEGHFPGIRKSKQGDDIEIWDLSKTPPVLRTFKASQVKSMKQCQTWKHPPASGGYNSQEMADIVGFLKWAATGSQAEIKPSDVE